jgi:hypothetical protein
MKVQKKQVSIIKFFVEDKTGEPWPGFDPGTFALPRQRYDIANNNEIFSVTAPAPKTEEMRIRGR